MPTDSEVIVFRWLNSVGIGPPLAQTTKGFIAQNVVKTNLLPARRRRHTNRAVGTKMVFSDKKKKYGQGFPSVRTNAKMAKETGIAIE